MTNTSDMSTIILNAEKKTADSNIGTIFNPTLIYVTRGNVALTIKDEVMNAPKDSIILLSPFDNARDFAFSEDAEFIELTIDNKRIYDIPSPVLVATLKSRPKDFANVIDTKSHPIFGMLFKKISVEFAGNEALRNTFLDNATVQLLIELYRLSFSEMPTRHIDLITEIEKYIDEQFMTNITIEELGSKFYLDRYYLSHIFREYTGYSLKQYLTLSRLNEARVLLSETELSINEICTTIGFSDINNFIRYFRKEYATTPLAYRKSILM